MSTQNAEDHYEGLVGPNRHKMPNPRFGFTHKVEIHSVDGGLQEGYITGNTFEDGALGELFLHGFGKEGSTLEGWTQVSAVLFSIALQYGGELPMLARKLAHMCFPPYGPTNNRDIPFCVSVPDYVVRWLALRFGPAELHEDLHRIAEEMRQQ